MNSWKRFLLRTGLLMHSVALTTGTSSGSLVASVSPLLTESKFEPFSDSMTDLVDWPFASSSSLLSVQYSVLVEEGGAHSSATVGGTKTMREQENGHDNVAEFWKIWRKNRVWSVTVDRFAPSTSAKRERDHQEEIYGSPSNAEQDAFELVQESDELEWTWHTGVGMMGTGTALVWIPLTTSETQSQSLSLSLSTTWVVALWEHAHIIPGLPNLQPADKNTQEYDSLPRYVRKWDQRLVHMHPDESVVTIALRAQLPAVSMNGGLKHSPNDKELATEATKDYIPPSHWILFLMLPFGLVTGILFLFTNLQQSATPCGSQESRDTFGRHSPHDSSSPASPHCSAGSNMSCDPDQWEDAASHVENDSHDNYECDDGVFDKENRYSAWWCHREEEDRSTAASHSHGSDTEWSSPPSIERRATNDPMDFGQTMADLQLRLVQQSLTIPGKALTIRQLILDDSHKMVDDTPTVPEVASLEAGNGSTCADATRTEVVETVQVVAAAATPCPLLRDIDSSHSVLLNVGHVLVANTTTGRAYERTFDKRLIDSPAHERLVRASKADVDGEETRREVLGLCSIDNTVSEDTGATPSESIETEQDSNELSTFDKRLIDSPAHDRWDRGSKADIDGKETRREVLGLCSINNIVAEDTAGTPNESIETEQDSNEFSTVTMANDENGVVAENQNIPVAEMGSLVVRLDHMNQLDIRASCTIPLLSGRIESPSLSGGKRKRDNMEDNDYITESTNRNKGKKIFTESHYSSMVERPVTTRMEERYDETPTDVDGNGASSDDPATETLGKLQPTHQCNKIAFAGKALHLHAHMSLVDKTTNTIGSPTISYVSTLPPDSTCGEDDDFTIPVHDTCTTSANFRIGATCGGDLNGSMLFQPGRDTMENKQRLPPENVTLQANTPSVQHRDVHTEADLNEHDPSEDQTDELDFDACCTTLGDERTCRKSPIGPARTYKQRSAKDYALAAIKSSTRCSPIRRYLVDLTSPEADKPVGDAPEESMHHCRKDRLPQTSSVPSTDSLIQTTKAHLKLAPKVSRKAVKRANCRQKLTKTFNRRNVRVGKENVSVLSLADVTPSTGESDRIEFMGSSRVSDAVIPEMPLSRPLMAAIESVRETCWVYRDTDSGPNGSRTDRHQLPKSIEIKRHTAPASRRKRTDKLCSNTSTPVCLETDKIRWASPKRAKTSSASKIMQK